MTAVPKPGRRKLPRQKCVKCQREFTARALFRHARRCGKKNRFGSVAKKTIVDGESFPSKLEADVWCLLKTHKKMGFVESIERYPSVELIPGLKWKVDFTVLRKNGERFWVEAKGVETERYLILKKLWAELGPGRLCIYKAGPMNPFIDEEIIPRRPI